MPSVLPELPILVSLRRLFPNASFVGCGDIVVNSATEDSRQVDAETLFAAIPGTSANGLHFVEDAISRGTPAILVEYPQANVDVPQCVVPNVRAAFSHLCDALVGLPARRLAIHGVTGTNGKTTTTWLIRSILQSAGHACGVMGTIEYNDGFWAEPASLTTPDAKTFSRWFRRMVNNGTTRAAIELSSHALHQGRIEGTTLSSAVVTNITQDHFDYHQTFEHYVAAKAKILDYIARRSGMVAICADDPGSRQLIEIAQKRHGLNTVSFGINNRNATVNARIESSSLSGSRFVVRGLDAPFSIRFPIPGMHNVLNALGAICVARHAGVPTGAMVHGLENIHQVPGRLQSIEEGQPFRVIVDYAHTDDALRRVIQALKPLTKGRLICLFGAGGDRDRTKRPQLAKAAACADVAVVTSDNPRTEDPNDIIEYILAGFPPGFKDFHTEPDRRTAIRWAINEAQAGDCVLIAGKGHESYQVIGKEKIDFDDREIVSELLSESNLHTFQLHNSRRVIPYR